MPPQSSATLPRLNPEKDKVRRGIAVVHDSGRKEPSMLVDHRDVGGFALDGP